MSTKLINIFGFRFRYENTKEINKISFGRCCLYQRVISDKKEQSSVKNIKDNHDDKFRIAVQLKGAMGDQLVGCNYVNALYNKFRSKDILIDIYCRPYIGETFLQEADFVNQFFLESKFSIQDEAYDLYIQLNRFPEILKYNEKKLQKYSVICKYVLLCENFKKQNAVFFTGRSEFDSILNIFTLIQNKKRFNQADIDNFLNIKEKFGFVPKLPESSVLQDYRLQKNKYITLHRGVDTNRSSFSNKQWPLENYNSLIKMLKSNFPKYKIVQLGVNKERCPDMKGTDISLVGKTTLTDIACLLKNSFLHIDGEGGMVHIRHAVQGGKSVVLFGPTSDAFYGYSENINIKENVCAHWCEHIRAKWDEGCIRSGGEALCMQKITPKTVMDKIKKNMRISDDNSNKNL